MILMYSTNRCFTILTVKIGLMRSNAQNIQCSRACENRCSTALELGSLTKPHPPVTSVITAVAPKHLRLLGANRFSIPTKKFGRLGASRLQEVVTRPSKCTSGHFLSLVEEFPNKSQVKNA